jgi:hypothetical protein
VAPDTCQRKVPLELIDHQPKDDAPACPPVCC